MSLQKESVSEKLVKRDSDKLRKNGEQLKAIRLQKESEWEKRFDSMFDLDGYGDSHIVQEKVKSFIRGVVFQREKEIAEEIEKYVLHFQALRDEQPEKENVMLAYDFDSRIVAAKQILKKILKH